MANERKKSLEVDEAYQTAKERLEKALSNNEDLCDSALKEKEELGAQIIELTKALSIEKKMVEEERAKVEELASGRASYLDMYTAVMEQFKQSTEFQVAVDSTSARSLAMKGGGEVGPSNLAVVELVEEQTKSKIIQNFQQSDYYKHQLSIYWDRGWVTFQQRVDEVFPDIDFTLIKPGEGDVAQTPLDEGVEEEDLVSS
ncbi:hypothetical protein CsSME_00030765 [Camellia sinensis var. sinensis]